ncbi:hypothetical protein SARC_07527 [Sphaeroforma arctica JP610]|uniref:Uncharacterized protein n=1 Tax=Sphaeroforma arctica JP610 TaxID=667725 RepID=A0A0L0FTH4_9EUKA|nr:hypothetical protein SARC_07527 [Sphaeroforma arctica JP610]KNC80105.1 hypothetical protein SARC_07527 [Sphaeroforma arctica JP610]|eukprot:XP_014154007.1 hypothetical protein SARC_07527 [Sphaeroforma arctica JP610]
MSKYMKSMGSSAPKLNDIKCQVCDKPQPSFSFSQHQRQCILDMRARHEKDVEELKKLHEVQAANKLSALSTETDRVSAQLAEEKAAEIAVLEQRLAEERETTKQEYKKAMDDLIATKDMDFMNLTNVKAEEIGMLKGQMAEKMEQIGLLKQMAQRNEEDRAALAAQLEEVRVQAESVESEKRALEEAIKAEKDEERDLAVAAIIAEKDDYIRNVCVDKGNQMAQKDTELQELKQRLEDVQNGTSGTAERESEIERLRQELQQKSGELESRNGELETTQSQLAQQLQDIEATRLELNEKENALHESEAKTVQKLEEKDRELAESRLAQPASLVVGADSGLQEQLEQVQLEKQSLQDELAAVKMSLADTQAALSEAESRQASGSGGGADHTVEIETLKSDIANLRIQNEQLQQEAEALAATSTPKAKKTKFGGLFGKKKDKKSKN